MRSEGIPSDLMGDKFQNEIGAGVLLTPASFVSTEPRLCR
jgi:hypothetical protein